MINNKNLPKIITDLKKIQIPCEPVESISEGEDIAKLLFEVLTNNGRAVGLAANQIGINKQVCVIKVKDPLYLINPKISEQEGQLIYSERCMSIPNRIIKTKRYSKFIVECDNIEGKMLFDVSHISPNKWLYDIDVMEAIVIQHEIDHLNGKTMLDYKLKPIKVEQKPGRNEHIIVTDGSNIKQIKYKKLEEYIENGWVEIKEKYVNGKEI